jgi:vacuole morphology and inheritance protein 14
VPRKLKSELKIFEVLIIIFLIGYVCLFRMVQDFNKNKNYVPIRNLIETFATQFCVSKDPNKRKGGLIALAACCIALGPADSSQFVSELLPPVLNCLIDPDTRVRYFASERFSF